MISLLSSWDPLYLAIWNGHGSLIAVHYRQVGNSVRKAKQWLIKTLFDFRDDHCYSIYLSTGAVFFFFNSSCQICSLKMFTALKGASCTLGYSRLWSLGFLFPLLYQVTISPMFKMPFLTHGFKEPYVSSSVARATWDHLSPRVLLQHFRSSEMLELIGPTCYKWKGGYWKSVHCEGYMLLEYISFPG